ncbi:MAG: prepilin-type N-terminal cleavage/methylation domain-containing protein [Planctomycetes bacterium]|nr:prepilin-type N-terminal cleavage/methylation domain-containing protein [Planctomycetota bacterium]
MQSTFRVYWTSALPRARRAFTLVEFMLVVAILGVLAALAVPRYQSAVTVARNAVAIREVNLLMNEIDRYKMRRGVLPDTLADIDRGETSDPWGHPYQFVVFDLAFAGRGAGGTNAAEVAGLARSDRFLVPLNSAYDLFSSGPDGESVGPLTAAPSQDDIVRASDGAFIGLASDY